MQTRTLKIFAQKLSKHYSVLQQLTLGMPDRIDADEYVGWVGAILKLMTFCEAEENLQTPKPRGLEERVSVGGWRGTHA